MASLFDFFPGPCSLLDFWQSLVDLLTNGSEAVVVERDRVLFFCTQDAQYVASADIDFVWSAVLDWHGTLIPVIETDQC